MAAADNWAVNQNPCDLDNIKKAAAWIWQNAEEDLLSLSGSCVRNVRRRLEEPSMSHQSANSIDLLRLARVPFVTDKCRLKFMGRQRKSKLLF